MLFGLKREGQSTKRTEVMNELNSMVRMGIAICAAIVLLFYLPDLALYGSAGRWIKTQLIVIAASFAILSALWPVLLRGSAGFRIAAAIFCFPAAALLPAVLLQIAR